MKDITHYFAKCTPTESADPPTCKQSKNSQTATLCSKSKKGSKKYSGALKQSKTARKLPPKSVKTSIVADNSVKSCLKKKVPTNDSSSFLSSEDTDYSFGSIPEIHNPPATVEPTEDRDDFSKTESQTKSIDFQDESLIVSPLQTPKKQSKIGNMGRSVKSGNESNCDNAHDLKDISSENSGSAKKVNAFEILMSPKSSSKKAAKRKKLGISSASATSSSQSDSDQKRHQNFKTTFKTRPKNYKKRLKYDNKGVVRHENSGSRTFENVFRELMSPKSLSCKPVKQKKRNCGSATSSCSSQSSDSEVRRNISPKQCMRSIHKVSKKKLTYEVEPPLRSGIAGKVNTFYSSDEVENTNSISDSSEQEPKPQMCRKQKAVLKAVCKEREESQAKCSTGKLDQHVYVNCWKTDAPIIKEPRELPLGDVSSSEDSSINSDFSPKTLDQVSGENDKGNKNGDIATILPINTNDHSKEVVTKKNLHSEHQSSLLKFFPALERADNKTDIPMVNASQKPLTAFNRKIKRYLKNWKMKIRINYQSPSEDEEFSTIHQDSSLNDDNEEETNVSAVNDIERTLDDVIVNGKTDGRRLLKKKQASVSTPIDQDQKTRSKSNLPKRVSDCGAAVKHLKQCQGFGQQSGHLPFIKVSHVQQKSDTISSWNLPNVLHSFEFKDIEPVVCSSVKWNLGSVSAITNPVCVDINYQNSTCVSFDSDSLKHALGCIQSSVPNFPVYGVLRNLHSKFLKVANMDAPLSSAIGVHTAKKSKNKRKKNTFKSKYPITQKKPLLESSSLWTVKYSPMNSHEVIGNTNIVCKLCKWLKMWLACLNPKQIKDFHIDYASSEDEFASNKPEYKAQIASNPVVLIGPHGVGKTAAIYALANGFNCKVLEINASSRRSGKWILTELQEATQSHNLGKESEKSSASKLFSKGGSRSSLKQTKPDSKPDFMSIVLVEEADLLFESEDEGYLTGLMTLLSTSKRPVVLIANNPNIYNLLRLENDLIFEFVPPPADITCAYLQLICLEEGMWINQNAIKNLFLQNNSDLRKTLLELQFFVLSCLNSNLNKIDRTKHSKLITDVLKTNGVASNTNNLEDMVYKTEITKDIFSNKEEGYKCISLSKTWWNLSHIIQIPQIHHQIVAKESDNLNYSFVFYSTDEESDDKVGPKDTIGVINPLESELPSATTASPENSCCEITGNHKIQYTQGELETLSILMDSLTLIDVLMECSASANPIELCPTYWSSLPSNCDSLNETFTQTSALQQSLVESICEATLELTCVCVKKTLEKSNKMICHGYHPPQEEIWWRKQQHDVDRTLAAAVPMNYCLDHRLLVTDYIPALRAIMRYEQDRMASKISRRNTRNFNHIKMLGVQLTDSILNYSATVLKD